MKPKALAYASKPAVMEDAHRRVIAGALAENTRKAYAKAWDDFASYCDGRRIEPLLASPDLVADFLIAKATEPSAATGQPLSTGSVLILSCAISRRFWEHELQSPTNHPRVVAVMRGLKRLQAKPPRQVKALREGHILLMLRQCEGGALIGLRDAAILAVGFSAALRRSELCALRVSDIEVIDDKAGLRMLVKIRKSKTDQEGAGQVIAVPDGRRIRPVSRVLHWLRAAEVEDGHVFRTLRRGGHLRGERLHHSDVPRLVKKYAALIGLDPKAYAGHSLRAGFVTSAAAHGARLDKIMEVTRHTNPQTVMKYIRDANVFTDHAGASFL